MFPRMTSWLTMSSSPQRRSSATASEAISRTWSLSDRTRSNPRKRRRSPKSLRGSIGDWPKRAPLIGFGRWGTSDPPLGIPVAWGQISGARVIVEATLPDVQPDLSQGSHFFHNLLSFTVTHVSVEHHGPYRIDWEWAWLPADCPIRPTTSPTYASSPPLDIRVDGAHGRGVISRHNG